MHSKAEFYPWQAALIFSYIDRTSKRKSIDSSPSTSTNSAPNSPSNRHHRPQHPQSPLNCASILSSPVRSAIKTEPKTVERRCAPVSGITWFNYTPEACSTIIPSEKHRAPYLAFCRIQTVQAAWLTYRYDGLLTKVSIKSAGSHVGHLR
jgi:hypothetical protein